MIDHRNRSASVAATSSASWKSQKWSSGHARQPPVYSNAASACCSADRTVSIGREMFGSTTPPAVLLRLLLLLLPLLLLLLLVLLVLPVPGSLSRSSANGTELCDTSDCKTCARRP